VGVRQAESARLGVHEGDELRLAAGHRVGQVGGGVVGALDEERLE